MKEKLTTEAREDLQNMISFLDKAIGEPRPIRPDGFGITVREYMNAKHCSETVARAVLEKGVKDGILSKQQMICGSGASPFVYYKSGSWPE